MKVNALPHEFPEKYRLLLLPEVVEQLSAGMPITVLILTEEDTACGAVAGYIRGSRFVISSLYVSRGFRLKGGGRLLLEKLIEQLPKEVLGLEISYTITAEEHQTLQPFLERMDFWSEPDNGETVFAISLSEMMKSPSMESADKRLGTPFSELETSLLFMASKEAERANRPLPTGGLLSETINKDASMAYVHNGKIESFVTIDMSKEEGLILLSLPIDIRTFPVTIKLLRSVIDKLSVCYVPDTKIITYSLSNVDKAMIRNLFPTAEEISYTYYKSI